MAKPRVLLVEDELLIAAAMQESLEDLGYEVVGPYKRVRDALRAAQEEPIDGAVLDVNLRDELVFPVAEALERRGVPFVFCTGYAEMSVIPEHFRDRPSFGKPCSPKAVAAKLAERLAARASEAAGGRETDLGL
jgi:CheY-like chemotaxis protein